MTEGQPQGDLFANKPKTDQREQTPSQQYPVGQGRKRLSIEDLKAVAEAEARTGDREVGETLQDIIDTPQLPQSSISGINQTPIQPPDRDVLSSTTNYPVGQGRQKLDTSMLPPDLRTPRRESQGGK